MKALGARSKTSLLKRRPISIGAKPEAKAKGLSQDILAQIKELVSKTGPSTDPPSKKGGEAPIPLDKFYAQAVRSLVAQSDGQSMSKEKFNGVPKVWKSSKDHPPAYLVYVTAEEAEILRAIDLHKSGVGTKMHYGPLRIPSLQGDGPGGGGGGGGGGGPDGGGGASDGPGSGQGADSSGTNGGGGTGVGGASGSSGVGGMDSPSESNAPETGGPGAPSGNNGMGVGPADGGRDVGPAPHSNIDVTNALEAANQAGVFGGIGSADPNAAMNGLAGLNAVGLGSAANPTSSFGMGFANAVASIMGQTPLGAVMGKDPLSTGLSLASLAAPGVLSGALSAINGIQGAINGTLGDTSTTGGFSGPSPSDAGNGPGMGGEQPGSHLAGDVATTQSQAPVTGGTGGAGGAGGGGLTGTPSGWAPPQVTSPNIPVASNPLLPAPDTYANAFNQFGANGQPPQRRLEAYIDASGRIAYRYV